VPDERLEQIAKVIGEDRSVEKLPAMIRFVDIAGLVKGAAKGEGLGNQFLAHIRECEVICFVLRDFENSEVVQTGSDPQSDLATLQTELILKDLETLEKCQKESSSPQLKQVLTRLSGTLNQGKLVSQLKLTQEERELIKPWCLLTAKPYFMVLNVAEKDLPSLEDKLKPYSSWPVLGLCAKLEEQLVALSVEEQQEYLRSLGFAKSGLERLIQMAYQALDLISFFTTTIGKLEASKTLAGKRRVQAWTLKKGTPAIKAADMIHSDFAKHFVKAKVIESQDFIKFGGWQKAKEAGRVRFEGRDYEIKEGEVVEFEINA